VQSARDQRIGPDWVGAAANRAFPHKRFGLDHNRPDHRADDSYTIGPNKPIAGTVAADALGASLPVSK